MLTVASSRNQRLGDMAAGTIVVRERTGGRTPRGQHKPGASFASAGVAGAALRIEGCDVSAISATDVATVRRFLERREDFTADARSNLAADLALRLRPRVAGAPAEVPAEEFLEAISAAKASRA